MPGKLKAKIVAGRHLPVMDRASDLTDAFVEVSMVHSKFTLKKTSGQRNFTTLSTHILRYSDAVLVLWCSSLMLCLTGQVWQHNFQNGCLPQVP